jgi:hypothetical protein
MADIFPKEPIAAFSLTKGNLGFVSLVNLSENAQSIIIDWGDGESNTYEFSGDEYGHQYMTNSTFNVRVLAYSKNKKKENTYSSQITIDNTKGTLFVYSKIAINAEYYKVYMTGKNGVQKYVGLTNKYYGGNIEVTCGNDVGITSTFEPGEYKMLVVTEPLGRGHWTSDVTIKNATCTKRYLE